VGNDLMPSTATIRAVIVLALGLASCGPEETAAPAIPFAPLVDSTIKDPDNAAKIFRIDFAEVQRRYPLSRTHLTALSPDNVKTLPQEKLDQIYGRITAGPLPSGAYRSEIFFAPDGSLKDRLAEVVGGFEGRLVGTTIDTLLLMVGAVWTGKIFDRDQAVVRTSIENLAPLQAFLGDTETIMTATIPRQGPLRFVMPDQKVWALFPASFIAGKAWSTAGASPSSSTKITARTLRATAPIPIVSLDEAACGCATKSAWSVPDFISGGPMSAECFC
jgi:hypothetical protein